MCKFLFTLLSLVSVAFAQTTGTATVVGTVTDNTGAIVPGAAINLVNTETQFVYNGETNTEGAYYVPEPEPGHVHGSRFRRKDSSAMFARESFSAPASSPASTCNSRSGLLPNRST